MRSRFFSLVACLSFSQILWSQNDSIVAPVDTTAYRQTDVISMNSGPAKSPKVYDLKPKIDIPIVAVGTGWSLYAFSKIYSKDSSTTAKILSLDKNNIPSFDRWATKHFDDLAWKSGNEFFYGSMPLPIVVSLIDKKLRKDFFKIAFLYWESMAITGFLYTGSVYLGDRYRPYAYNPDVDMKTRSRGGAKNSFYAGHVALVATSAFFTASILKDYHPDSKIKWVYYGAAGALTAAVAYKRLIAGQHFPSDILLGMAQGTLTGILVPRLHKTKFVQEHISIFPMIGNGNGIAVVYKF